MFLKEKYNRSSQKFTNYKSTSSSNNIFPNKYHNRQIPKKKTNYNKKTSFQNTNKYNSNQSWKKQFFYNNWKDNKENDKNYTNYLYHPNNNIKNNSTKNYFYTFETEEIYTNKDSLDCTTTQSNSSTHEESANTETNSHEIEKENISNSSENINLNNEKKEEKINQNLNKNLENKKNDSADFVLNCQNVMNSNNNSNSQKIIENNDNKYYKGNSSSIIEPYNKFNSVNQELNISPMINSIIENTEILNVNVKIAKDKNAIFKLRRFDDLFLTVKLFCEINSIDEKMMKPIISIALCTLNSIYQIYNTKLDMKNIRVLQMLNTFDNIDN